jgi:hypothetical protein
MRRFLSLLLAAFIAFMPLAGMACDAAQASPASGAMPCHPQDVPAENDPGASCADMKGCCAAALIATPACGRSPVMAEDRSLPLIRIVAGFVPDPQYRPPVP